MTRCHLKRSAKTAGALMVAFIMVVGLIDTRNRYNNFMANIESSEPYPPADLGLRKEGGNRYPMRLNAYDNKTEHATMHRIQQYHSSLEVNDINNNEISLPGDTSLPTDLKTITLRFWDLVNISSMGASTKALFTNAAHLPSLWRPEKDYLSRDEDRVLAQLIWAMEAANASSLSSRVETKVNLKQ